MVTRVIPKTESRDRIRKELAFLAAILTDGPDIKSISHLGRAIPARLRTAVTAGDPVCVVPGCNNARFLKIDPHHPSREARSHLLGELGWAMQLPPRPKELPRVRAWGRPGNLGLESAQTAAGTLTSKSPLDESLITPVR